jgi:hypothetical protein
MLFPFDMTSGTWNTDTLKVELRTEGWYSTVSEPGGYTVAIGTSQQKAATATSSGAFVYNLRFKNR